MYRAPTLKDFPPAAKTAIMAETGKKLKKHGKKKHTMVSKKAPSNLLPRKMGKLAGSTNPLWEDVLAGSNAARPMNAAIILRANAPASSNTTTTSGSTSTPSS
ncbi:hypothetical protein EBT25_01780 [bacterium]|jgi:hypothetical protein|nr:hypothetical protein [bacterium]